MIAYKKSLFLFTAATMLIAPRCFAPAMTITAPGLYELGEDISFSPVAADNIIDIQSSNVILDLGGHIVEQGNSTAGVNGVNVGSGFSNVKICNGTVQNVTNIGINITSSSNDYGIMVDNILSVSCQKRGLSITNTQQPTITNCTFLSCAQGNPGDAVISCNAVRYAAIRDINITSPAITTTGTWSGIAIVSSPYSLIENIEIGILSGNTVSQLNGILCSTSDSILFSNVNVMSILALNSCSCFNANGNTSIIFANCKANSLAATNGTCNFFLITSSLGTSTPCLFIGCSVTSMSGNTINGFNATNCIGYSFIDCIVQGCNSSTGSISPFLLTTCDRCALIRCYALFNRTTVAAGQVNSFTLTSSTNCSLYQCIAFAGTATGAGSAVRGFFPNGSTGCMFQECAAHRNLAATAALSFGFVQGGTTNAFIRNVALLNNTTAANQFVSFAAGQSNTQAVTAVNSITQPHTNAGLV